MAIDFLKREIPQGYAAPIKIDEGSAHRGAVLIEKLNELASLHGQGELSDEEFAAAKAAVIVSL
ncbi:SHOCT domain-containing protein [Arthrobacter sp. PAMC25284]|uniref:SHOCT domain-containing protein n=1 Tax=Arthrobacter sp. PAMC25284 TaxID=2861279 RepID=UPI001C630C68|nr:SHOCT domain-containing protein [Arthrobacter sp. PAMC25284]QYF88457.1 SHOCT domain-containing protein [Arthrobacter sp. PAMC25284]